MLTITDIYGNTEGLAGYKNLRRYRNVSGEKSLAFFVLPTQQNAHSFEMVAEESIVEFDGEPYRIKQIAEKPKGSTYIKDVVAVHTLFDLIDDHKYELHTGSLTFDAALTFVLAGTGYTWVIADTFYAEQFENFGDDNRLALLQDVLKHYGAEFTLNGTQLTFRRRIGNSTDFQFRYNYNVKTLARDVNTNNLSTYIKGYGKDGLTSEYTSPNASVFGVRHAKPIRDERYTTLAGLNERLVAELQDTPEISITIDFADMRRAGYPYDVPNEGDDVFLIYEPMGIDVEARLVEVTELFTESSALPTKTEVTLANIRQNMTDRMVEYSRTQKQVGAIMDGTAKLPYSVLDDAVKRATEALQSAQTELEFNNGLIAREKTDPNRLVLLNSAGLGVSTDGGNTMPYAITADGIVADLITVGTMLFDRVKGGTMTLGGVDNGNGKMTVLNAAGEQIADLDAERGGFSNLYVGSLESPNVVAKTTAPFELYVAATAVNAGYEPSDSNSGADWNNALLTINEAIRRIPKYVDHDVTIWLAYGQDYPRGFSLYGFNGSGTISIKSTGLTKVREFAYVYNNTCNIYIENIHFYTTSSYVAIHNQASNNLYVWGCRFYGLPNNGTDYGVRTTDNGFTKIISCEFYSVQIGVIVYHGGRTYVYNNTGNCAQNAFYASGGTIFGGGSTPTAPTIIKTDLGGSVSGFTNPTGTGGANNIAPDAAYTTATWSATGGNNWSQSYNAWGNDGVKQGNYGYGRRTGFWFFGSAPSTAVTGKSIKSIRVLIQRQSKGGSSGKIPITLRWHTHATQPSSPADLDLSAETASVSLGWGESAWVALPSSFYPYFANGTAKGVGVYSGDSNYAILANAATLEITYA